VGCGTYGCEDSGTCRLREMCLRMCELRDVLTWEGVNSGMWDLEMWDLGTQDKITYFI